MGGLKVYDFMIFYMIGALEKQQMLVFCDVIDKTTGQVSSSLFEYIVP